MRHPLTNALFALSIPVAIGCGGASDQTPPTPHESAAKVTTTPTTTESPIRLPDRRAMTATERRAIAQARTRRAATQPTSEIETASTEDGSVLIGSVPSGLTKHEQRAALDDPAAHMQRARDRDAGAAPTPTPSANNAPNTPNHRALDHRPGVELRGAVDGLKLVDLAIATEVKRREPLGVGDHFADVPRMFHCFCVFENRQQATNVTHVWKRDGRVVSRVELEVGKSPKWRTWSRQRLQPTWAGKWTCEVQTMTGRMLGLAAVRAGR